MKNLTEGRISRHLLFLAWPSILLFTLNSSFNVIDLFWVGRLGANAVAAVSIAFVVIFLIMAFGIGLEIGTNSVISRYLGEGNKKSASDAMIHSLVLGIIMSGVILLSFFILEELLLGLGVGPDIFDMTYDYLSIIILGHATYFLVYAAFGVFFGAGDTKTPLKITAILLGINFILDPIFILGFSGFPAMGIVGAAYATIISRGIGMVLVIYLLLVRKTVFQFEIRSFKIQRLIFKRILIVNIPSVITFLAVSMGEILLMRNVAMFGTYAIASYGISMRLDIFAILPAVGLQIATLAIVGQNVGAKKFSRARKTAWASSLMSIAILGGIGLIFWVWAPYFLSIFSNNLQVIEVGTEYLQIVALTYAFRGLTMTLGSAFQGAGDAKPPMILSIVSSGILAVTSAYILSIVLNFGILGVWYAIAGSAIFSGITNTIWFKLFQFKTSKKVT